MSKKILALILAVLTVIAVFPFAFANDDEYNALDEVIYTRDNWQHEKLTKCNGDDASPIIIIPGIMQSQVYVTDKDGNYIMTSEKTPANNYRGFPVVEGMDMSFMFDTNAIADYLKSEIDDMLKAMVKNDKEALYDIVVETVDRAMSSHYFNDDGTRVNGASVDEYWYSCEVASHTKERSYKFAKGYSKDENGNTLPTEKYHDQYDFIFRQVDMTSYSDKYGLDHMYYYAYSSFGNILEAADGLYDYIDMVKTQTGHDKVTLCFISLGGTIANTFLADERFDADSIDRIILAAAALNGSYLLSDLMDANTTLTDGNALYNDLLPNIIALVNEEYMSLAYLGNTAIRVIPQNLFSNFLQEALTRAIDGALCKLVRNCQSMWALVPPDVYPELSAKYISDESHAALKEMTDRYYNIQKNAAKTIREREEQEADIFIVCGYDLQLPALVGHYAESSDNIIQAASTSCGATVAPAGKTLSDEYLAKADPKYISPDKMIDASTGALPDKTFFIKGQSHLTLQSAVNDTIELCVQLAINHNIKNANTQADGYVQFNEYRYLKTIENLIEKYEKAVEDGTLASLSSKKRQAVDSAYEKAKSILKSRVWNSEEAKEVEKDFYTAMYNAKLIEGKSAFVKYKLLPVLTRFFKWISDIAKKILKSNDYWLFN
ncbi:MAG: hypothetical protein K6B52_08130 [Clostridiales bacterium]|nr:hypothetical protein [Clostridiales bacterium]